MMSSSSHAGGRVARELGLQIAVDEVDLLLAAEALADVLGADLPHPLDRLQLAIGGGKQLLQPSELRDDPLDHHLRQTRDAAQNPDSAGGDRIVEAVELAVIAEQL